MSPQVWGHLVCASSLLQIGPASITTFLGPCSTFGLDDVFFLEGLGAFASTLASPSVFARRPPRDPCARLANDRGDRLQPLAPASLLVSGAACRPAAPSPL